MGLFDTKSTTNQSADNSVTNQQVGAEGRSVAVGANANVNITSVDDKVVDAVTSFAGDVSRRSFESVDSFVEAQKGITQGVTKDVIAGANANANSALAFGRDALNVTNRTLGEANQLLNNSFERSLVAVQRSQGIDDSTIVSESNSSNKMLVGLLVVGGIALAWKGKN